MNETVIVLFGLQYVIYHHQRDFHMLHFFDGAIFLNVSKNQKATWKHLGLTQYTDMELE